MSLRYTLRLLEHGAEVWKRWTGDQREAFTDLATTVQDLNIAYPRLERFVNHVTSMVADTPNMAPGDQRETSVLDDNLTTQLVFEVRMKGHNVSSQ